MNATTTRQALLRDILANPASDALRLIYADLVEEEELEYAEFIRVQCEIAESLAFVEDWYSVPGRAEDGKKAGSLLARAQSLQRRERKLLAYMSDCCCREWVKSDLLKGLPGKCPVLWLDDLAISVGKGDEVKGPPKKYFLRRGFVHRVECSCDDWMQCGSRIVACQPVEVVRLTDKEPAQLDNWGQPRWRYWCGVEGSDEIPPRLFDLLPWPGGDYGYTFDTREALQDALSVACLRLAKGEKA